MGTTSRETVGTQVVVETGVETAFGGRLGGGTDVLLGRHFMVNASAGYNLVSDFSEPVGGRDNYSGFEMRVGVSWSFGWGRRVSQLRGLSS